MWCPTLFFTLLLLTAAGLISGAALPPSLPIQNPQTPGLSLNCHRIPSQPATRRLPNIRDPTTSVTVPGSLSPRVLPYCIEGVLTGGQHSSDFTLSPQHVWKLYWVDERLVLGGTVQLWRVDTRSEVFDMVDSTPMANRELNPFTPEVGWEYYVTFQGAPQGRISWYFATQ